MKKIFLLIMIIIFLLTTIIYSKKIKGTKINNYLYKLNISTNDILIDKNTIYYLENNTLKTQNIFKKTSKQSKLSNCSFNNALIYCSNNTHIDVYDLSLKHLTSINSNTILIPYKNTYLKYENNTLFKENQILKTFSTSNITYKYLPNNTYLLFIDETNNTSSIYDINNDSLIDINTTNYNTYDLGFYFYDLNSFYIYDLVNNKYQEYPNYLNKTNYEASLILNNNLYLISNSQLYIFDLTNFTYQTLNLNNNYAISKIYGYNNYLYLLGNNIYLLNLKKLNLPHNRVSDLITLNNEEINKTISYLKTNYNLNINIKNNALNNYPDFIALKESNNLTISTALTKLENIITKFDNAFFTSFYDYDYQGLNLYLTGDLAPKNYATQIANPAAYSLMQDKKYMIVININEPNIEEIFCHELMHNIEFNLSKNNTLFTNWDSLNPPEFYYNNSYTKPYIFDYTINEDDINNVYFTDKYSHTYADEDRARIFEAICAYEKSPLTTYPNLITKAKYLETEILKYYPNLTIFQSLYQ